MEKLRGAMVEAGCADGVIDTILRQYGCDAAGRVAVELATVSCAADWAIEPRTERKCEDGSCGLVRESEHAEPMPEQRAMLECLWDADRQRGWDGLHEAEDVRAEIHRRLSNYARVGEQSQWWMMEWSEMTVVYVAAITGLELGKLKKLMRKMRQATDEWWRKMWSEWRAIDYGVDVWNKTERLGVMLEGWAAAREMLGDDYRSGSGRRMPSASEMRNRTWVSVGAQLRGWMTDDAKARLRAAVLVRADGSAKLHQLTQAGVRLDQRTEELRVQPEDEELAELRELRSWDVAGAAKRLAKEVMADDEVAEADREAALRWRQESEKRQAAHPRKGAKRLHCRIANQAAESRRLAPRVRDQKKSAVEYAEAEEETDSDGSSGDDGSGSDYDGGTAGAPVGSRRVTRAMVRDSVVVPSDSGSDGEMALAAGGEGESMEVSDAESDEPVRVPIRAGGGGGGAARAAARRRNGQRRSVAGGGGNGTRRKESARVQRQKMLRRLDESDSDSSGSGDVAAKGEEGTEGAVAAKTERERRRQRRERAKNAESADGSDSGRSYPPHRKCSKRRQR